MQGLNIEQGVNDVYAGMRSIGQYQKLNDTCLTEMIRCAVIQDVDYISGLNMEGSEEYDEDKAFALIVKALKKDFPNQKSLIESFVDDYMEAWEIYLESIGAISWDGE